MEGITMTFFTSQSKVNTWLDCRRKYHYRNVDHLKPTKKARPLMFGGVVHDMIDAKAAGKDEFKVLETVADQNRKLFKEEEEMYGRITEDLAYIMRAYNDFWKKDPIVLVPFKKRKAEHPFEVEITSEITAKGKIDGIAKMKTFKWLLEHKTHKEFPDDNHRWRNLQSAVYIRILQMLGVEDLQGTLWNYIRSKPPTRPQMLKAGSLSTKSIDTLPQVVIDTIDQNDLNPDDYADFIKVQRDNLPSWFQRVYSTVKPKVVKALFADFVTVSREMADYYDKNPNTPPPRTVARHCSWCPFEPLCRAEYQGNDVDYILEHEFVVDESDYQREVPDAA